MAYVALVPGTPQSGLEGHGFFDPVVPGARAYRIEITSIPEYYGHEGVDVYAYYKAGHVQEWYGENEWGLPVPVRSSPQLLVSQIPSYTYGLYFDLPPGVVLTITALYDAGDI